MNAVICPMCQCDVSVGVCPSCVAARRAGEATDFALRKRTRRRDFENRLTLPCNEGIERYARRIAREYHGAWRCLSCGTVTPARAWLDVGGCPHFRNKEVGSTLYRDRCRCAVFERAERKDLT